jgi:hypothetical protein
MEPFVAEMVLKAFSTHLEQLGHLVDSKVLFCRRNNSRQFGVFTKDAEELRLTKRY